MGQKLFFKFYEKSIHGVFLTFFLKVTGTQSHKIKVMNFWEKIWF